MLHLWSAIRGLPAKLSKIEKRDVRFFIQRLTRGWDDSETWSLDHSFAKMIAPRLRRFREITIATPPDKTPDEWTVILDTMIEGFKFIGSEEFFLTDDEEKHEVARKALDLFSQNYYDLWW